MFSKRIAALVSVVLLCSSLAFSWGISCPYWSSNPLKLRAGERVTVLFNLQNGLGDPEERDLVIVAELTEGSEVAQIKGKGEYFLPFGTLPDDEVNIPVTVKVPKKANVGDTWRVNFRVMEKNPTGFLTVAYSCPFDVVVIE